MRHDDLWALDGDRLRFNPHPGQVRAWDCNKRFVVVVAGTQSGKTAFGPIWLWREIQQAGPGDYIVVTPTFPLLDKKALPEFRRLFEDRLKLGRYVGSPSRRFDFSEEGQKRAFDNSGEGYETTVWFGYATNPDSLESATAKGAWLDEAGQPSFKLGSWEAIQRRLSIHQGRALFTTTPYYIGWLRDLLDKPEVGTVNFRSTENPTFPVEEYERARRDMPAWKFDMFYNGIFTRPAGLIYDVFDKERHVIEPFVIPYYNPRFLGLDFGGVNTAGIFIAQMGDESYVVYREYLAGGMTAAGHADAFQEPGIELTAYGGAASEDQWRKEFTAAGLRVYAPPVSDVEVGINRVYKLLKTNRLKIFSTCVGLIDQLNSYSRPVDEAGNVLEGIQDKEIYHYLDALRYIGAHLSGGAATVEVTSYAQRNYSTARQRPQRQRAH